MRWWRISAITPTIFVPRFLSQFSSQGVVITPSTQLSVPSCRYQVRIQFSFGSHYLRHKITVFPPIFDNVCYASFPPANISCLRVVITADRTDNPFISLTNVHSFCFLRASDSASGVNYCFPSDYLRFQLLTDTRLQPSVPKHWPTKVSGQQFV